MPDPRKPVTRLTDAQIVANLQQDNTRLQAELAKTQAELKSTAEKVTAKEQLRKNVELELTRLKPSSVLLKNVTPEVDGLWGGLKTTLDALTKEQARTRELTVLAEKKDAEHIAATARLNAELDKATKAVQSSQVQSLAKITELQNALKALQTERDSLQKLSKSKDAEWNKERAKLKAAAESVEAARKSAENSILEYRKADELFAQSVVALRAAVPSLADVEQTPVTIMKTIFQELLDARRKLERIDILEAQLKDEQAKNATADNLDARVGLLIEENRALQEQLDAVNSENRLFAIRAQEANVMLKTAVSDAVAAANAETQQAKLDLASKLSSVQAENASLLQQMDSTKKVAFVAPERVSALLDDFYSKISSNLKGLDVRDSEVRLKVGFGSLSDSHAGFVIPTAGNAADIKDSLGEIVLKLGKKDI